MERLHLHTIQQLQLELAEARERSGAYTDDGRVSQTNLKDVSHFGQNNGSQLNVNGNDTSSGTGGVLRNGSADNIPSFVSSGHASALVVLLIHLLIGCLFSFSYCYWACQ